MDNQNVGAAPQPGADGSPGQPVSTPETKPIDGDVTKLLAGLGEKFDGLEKQLRGLQGRQDKAENNFQAQLARLNQYKSQGMSEPEALAEMEADDRSEQRWTSLESRLEKLAARLESGGNAQNAQQAAAQVFQSIGLDLKDPRVAVALAKQYDNADQLELAAYRLSRELAQAPNPTPAQGASLPGGATGNAGGTAAKIARLAELQQRPSLHMTEIAALTKELEASGWQ